VWSVDLVRPAVRPRYKAPGTCAFPYTRSIKTNALVGQYALDKSDLAQSSDVFVAA
jgi:hypothetical protein